MTTQPTDSSLIPHVKEILQMLAPIFGVVIGLVAYAWRSMERNIDRLEQALKTHCLEDSTVHNQLFSQDRKISADLAELDSEFSQLKGEHEVYHKGD